MAGENKNHGMTSYSSSKAAVNHLTRNMAFDLGPMGIRVNAIAPGAIKTHALATVLTPEIEEQMLKHTPLGPSGRAAGHRQRRPVPRRPRLVLGERPGDHGQRRRHAGAGVAAMFRKTTWYGNFATITSDQFGRRLP